MNWWCALSLWLLGGWTTLSQPAGLEAVKRSRPLLGTFVTIRAYGPDRAELNAAVTAAFDQFNRVDALMSVHRPDSELSRLNAEAGAGPVEVSSDLYHVLQTARQIARRTGGAFDVTIKPLADLWGFIWKEYRMPTPAELDEVLPRVNYQHVELNPAEQTVRFTAPEVAIDLGGIAKGYAVDCAIETLRQRGITNTLVNAGGDLRVSGLPPGETAWTVQLEDPQKQGNRLQFRLKNGALATSGNYENFFEIDGQRYSHLLDPRTGRPVGGIAACSVIAPTCLEADAWATACFVYGVDETLEQFGDQLAVRFTRMPTPKRPDDWPVRQSESFPKVLSKTSK